MVNDSGKATPHYNEDNLVIDDTLIADIKDEQKAVNIVARLPYEVQIFILEQVATTRLLLYLLQCSPEWRKVVEDNSMFWKQLTIAENDPLPRDDLELIFGGPISRHITDLNLFVDSPCYSLLLDTMAAGNFTHLQRLTVDGNTFGNHDQLFAGLRGVAGTLLELSISCEASEIRDFLPLAEVLSACPSLQSLAYEYYRQPSHEDDFLLLGDDNFAPTPSIGQWTAISPNLPLKHFKLNANDMPSDFQMQRFFECCPNLVSIELSKGDRPLVAHIHEHCQKVQRFTIRDVFEYEAVINDDNDAYWTWQLKSLDSYTSSWTGDYFMPHIQRSASTLESLGLEETSLWYSRGWQALKTINLPNVRHLKLCSDSDRVNEVVALIDHFSATVQSLSLSGFGLDDPMILNRIAQLQMARPDVMVDYFPYQYI